MTPVENPITMVKPMTAKRRQPTGGAVGRAAEELVDVGAPDPEDADDPDLAAPCAKRGHCCELFEPPNMEDDCDAEEDARVGAEEEGEGENGEFVDDNDEV